MIFGAHFDRYLKPALLSQLPILASKLSNPPQWIRTGSSSLCQVPPRLLCRLDFYLTRHVERVILLEALEYQKRVNLICVAVPAIAHDQGRVEASEYAVL